jgi:hypothetical protein
LWRKIEHTFYVQYTFALNPNVSDITEQNWADKKKGKVIPVQAVEALRVLRG